MRLRRSRQCNISVVIIEAEAGGLVLVETHEAEARDFPRLVRVQVEVEALDRGTK